MEIITHMDNYFRKLWHMKAAIFWYGVGFCEWLACVISFANGSLSGMLLWQRPGNCAHLGLWIITLSKKFMLNMNCAVSSNPAMSSNPRTWTVHYCWSLWSSMFFFIDAQRTISSIARVYITCQHRNCLKILAAVSATESSSLVGQYARPLPFCKESFEEK